MRPRIHITEEQIRAALVASDGDLGRASEWLEVVRGIDISARTLRRRMAEMGIRQRVVRVITEEAA